MDEQRAATRTCALSDPSHHMSSVRVEGSDAAWGVYDEVRKDGELVGLSHARAYEADVRSMISIAVVGVERSEPGTGVTVVWGEPGGESPNPKVEEHAQTEIRATVGPVPYTEDRRKARPD